MLIASLLFFGNSLVRERHQDAEESVYVSRLVEMAVRAGAFLNHPPARTCLLVGVPPPPPPPQCAAPHGATASGDNALVIADSGATSLSLKAGTSSEGVALNSNNFSESAKIDPVKATIASPLNQNTVGKRLTFKSGKGSDIFTFSNGSGSVLR